MADKVLVARLRAGGEVRRYAYPLPDHGVTNSYYLPDAPHNLLPFSQNLDRAEWVKSAASITANNATAPDGTTSADKLVESGTNATHHTYVPINLACTAANVFSLYAKAAGRTWIALEILGETLASNARCYFDLTNGVTGTTSTSGSGVEFHNVGIEDAGNGFWRCWISARFATRVDRVIVYLASANGTISYTGNGSNGAQLWGAQFERATAPRLYLASGAGQAHDESVPQNILVPIHNLHSTWAVNQSTLSSVAITGPDGAPTVCKLTENGATAAHSMNPGAVVQIDGLGVVAVYVKAAGRDYVALYVANAAFTNAVRAIFDLANCVVGTPTLTGTGLARHTAIAQLPDGWYRIELGFDLGTSQVANLQIRLCNSATVDTYTGNSAGAIYVSSPQLLLTHRSCRTPFVGGTWARLATGTLVACGSSLALTLRTSEVFETGKSYYWEATLRSGASCVIGVVTDSATITENLGQNANGWGYRQDGNKYTNNTATAFAAAYVAGDTIGVAMVWTGAAWDLHFIKNPNGVLVFDSGNRAFVGITGTGMRPAIGSASGTVERAVEWNLGLRPFKGVPSAGVISGVYRVCKDAARYWATRGIVLTDGAELVHAAPLIMNDPSYVRSVRAWPWAPGEAQDEIGEIVLNNGDGELDDFRAQVNRDRGLDLFVGEATATTLASLTQIGAPVVQEVLQQSAGTIAIAIRNRDALADVSLQPNTYSTATPNTALRGLTKPLSIGALRWVPPPLNDGPNLELDVHQDGRFRRVVELRDQAAVSTKGTGWADDDQADVAGFKRLTGIVGRQACQVEGVVKPGTLVLSELFDAWTGDNPNSWTTVEQDANNRVTQSPPGQARFQKNGGGTATYIERNLALANGTYYLVAINVAAYASGNLIVWSSNGTLVTPLLNVNAAAYLGMIYVCFTPASGYASIRVGMAAASSGDVTVADLEVHQASWIERLPDLLDWVGVTQTARLATADIDTAGSITTLDTAAPYKLCFHLVAGQQIAADEFMRLALDSFCGAFYCSATGVLKVWRLEPPGGTPTITLYEDDLEEEPTVEPDTAPNLSTQLGYARNFAVHQPGEIAGSVQGTTVGAELAAEWQVKRGTATLSPSYLHAVAGRIVPTLHSDGTLTQQEADRVTGMFAVDRNFVRFGAVVRDQVLVTSDMGALVQIVAASADLDGGKLARLIELRGKLLSIRVAGRAWT